MCEREDRVVGGVGRDRARCYIIRQIQDKSRSFNLAGQTRKFKTTIGRGMASGETKQLIRLPFWGQFPFKPLSW